MKKFPGGTPDRWEKIADMMNRTVAEVTHMAKKVVRLLLFFIFFVACSKIADVFCSFLANAPKVKDEGLKPSQPAEEVPVETEEPKKVKTRAKAVEAVVEWSQDEQKALEAALLKYPKTGSTDRWEKIATCIEGKTKVCLFDFLFFFAASIIHNVWNVLLAGRVSSPLSISSGNCEKETYRVTMTGDFRLFLNNEKWRNGCCLQWIVLPKYLSMVSKNVIGIL